MVEDYIRVFEDAITPEFSKQLLAHYLYAPYQKIDLDWRSCVSVGFGPEYPELFATYRSEMSGLFTQYKAEINVKTLHNITRVEHPNIFGYAPDGKDHFHQHADCWNPESSTRQVSIIVYLTDVDEGGETKFPKYGLTVKPKARQALVFPSSWQYEHLALPPKSNEKIILVSWLHYGPNTGYLTYPL